MTIAGHEFVETSRGLACECGRLWSDIASTSSDDIGKLGIAHTGSLYASEYEEIAAKRERDWQCVKEVCSP